MHKEPLIIFFCLIHSSNNCRPKRNGSFGWALASGRMGIGNRTYRHSEDFFIIGCGLSGNNIELGGIHLLLGSGNFSFLYIVFHHTHWRVFFGCGGIELALSHHISHHSGYARQADRNSQGETPLFILSSSVIIGASG